MNMKLVSMVVGVTGLLALAACDSAGTGNTGGGNVGGQNVGGQNIGGGGGNVPTGAACNDFLNSDAASSTWSTTAVATDFIDPTAFDAYDALNTCACVNKLADNGCEDVCTIGDNGTQTPNFCDSGKTPNQNTGAGSCYGCLMQNCSAELAACASN